MLRWYSGKDVGIWFSDRPNVSMRVILPGMSQYEIESIREYPFINNKSLKVWLTDYKKLKSYSFTIPKGYCWDGATIPRIFWRIIGSKTDSAFLIPSMVHDVLCEHHIYVGNDRHFSSKVFERLLYVAGVPALNRFIMFHTVDIFQKFQDW